MRLSKVLISVVLSLLFVSLFSGICQAGELNERDKFKRLRLMGEQDNPWKMGSPSTSFPSGLSLQGEGRINKAEPKAIWLPMDPNGQMRWLTIFFVKQTTPCLT